MPLPPSPSFDPENREPSRPPMPQPSVPPTPSQSSPYQTLGNEYQRDFPAQLAPEFPSDSGDMSGQKKSKKPKIIVGAAAVCVALGVGAVAYGYGSVKPDPDRPYAVLSADAVVYAEANFDPSISQKAAYLKLNDKIKKSGQGASVEEALVEAFDEDLTYADVEPWVGDRYATALYIDESDKGDQFSLFQIKDESAAKKFVDSREDAKIIGKYVVTSRNSKWELLEKGDRLSENKKFLEQTKSVGADNIGLVWSDIQAEDFAGLPPTLQPAQKDVNVAGSLSIVDNGFRADIEAFGASETGIPELSGKVGDAFNALPANTTASIVIPELGQVIEDYLGTLGGSASESFNSQLSAVGLNAEGFSDLLGDKTVLSALGSDMSLHAQLYNGKLTPQVKAAVEQDNGTVTEKDGVVVITSGATTPSGTLDVSKYVVDADKSSGAVYINLTEGVKLLSQLNMGSQEIPTDPIGHLGISMFSEKDSVRMVGQFIMD